MTNKNQIKTFRIKAAGKSIKNIGYCIILSNIVLVFAFYSISKATPERLNSIISLSSVIFIILSIAILLNILDAGDHLIMCENPETDKYDEQSTVKFFQTTENVNLKIIFTKREILGAEVFIGDGIAPDGDYKLNSHRRILIKNGKIIAFY